MTANLVIHRDPYRANLNVETTVVKNGETIFQTLHDKGLCFDDGNGLKRIGNYLVILNGKAVLQKEWNTVINDNDVLQVSYLPKGGGGSNLKNILVAIVVVVLAYFTFGMSLVASAALGVVAFAALSMMTGAIPPPTGNIGKSDTTSPTYSLSAQGNSARLLEGIPRVYGRMRTFPDLAAQPYSEYQGNEQYLYQLFCVSVGYAEIEKIMVDDADLNGFEDAEIEIIHPGGVVSLFPDNVVTSEAVQQLEMVGPNNPNYGFLGPYVSAPAGTTTNKIGIDIAFPRGAANIDFEGKRKPSSVSYTFQKRLINDQGQPLEDWTILFNSVQTFATDRAQLISHIIDVPPGRYEVRGTRDTNDPTETNIYNNTQWVGMRAYLTSTYVYGNVTLIAVKMRATNVLNSSTARKFSVISKGHVQKWDPVNGWGALEFSDNPAWCAADILRNTDYGRGLPTERLAIEKFYQLSQTWDARNDKFNGVFDTTTQLWEALTTVLRVGRAIPMYYAGVIDIIRDQPQAIPTAMFSASNMVMGSFKTTYNFFDNDTPDHVIVEYIDTETWKTAQVKCVLPGGTALNPYNVKFIGITDRDQAWREGISIAAGNRDRRRNISFSALTAGLVPMYNGLIRVAHDVPQWGYFGRVLGFNKANGKLRSSEPIVFSDASPHVIAFRRRDGSEDGPYVMQPDPTLSEDEFGCVVVGTQAHPLAAIYISDGVREDYTYYQCGPTTKQGILALVMSAVPDAEGKVTLNCINYAESVYTAENGGTVPAPPPESNLPNAPAAPVISNVQVNYTVTVGMQQIIASPANGAIYYEYEAKLDSALNWTKLGSSDSPTLTAYLAAGLWSVRVRAVGIAVGAWTTWTGTIEATSLATPRIETFTANPQLFAIGLQWSYTAESASIAAKVEVWAGFSNVLGNATKLLELPYPANAYVMTNLAAGQRIFFWIRVIDTAGRTGQWFNNAAPITQIAESNPDKILDALNGSITSSQLSQELQEEIAEGGGSATAIEEIRGELEAAITLRAQVRTDDQLVIAGIGIGVEEQAGELISQVIVMAQRFAVTSQADPNGEVKTPFIIENGSVYIDSAFIQDATIINALIGATLNSVAVDSSGNPLVSINFQTGEFILRGENASGSTKITPTTYEVFGPTGIRRLRMGIWSV